MLPYNFTLYSTPYATLALLLHLKCSTSCAIRILRKVPQTFSGILSTVNILENCFLCATGRIRTDLLRVHYGNLLKQNRFTVYPRYVGDIQTELKCCPFVLCWINIFILSSLLHVCNVRPLGLEPRTHRLKICCSTY